MSIYNVARSIGLGILLSVVVGLLSGLVGFSNLSFYPYFLFFVTYIPSGVMAVLLNKESPYSAAYFTGLTLSVLRTEGWQTISRKCPSAIEFNNLYRAKVKSSANSYII